LRTSFIRGGQCSFFIRQGIPAVLLMSGPPDRPKAKYSEQPTSF
jgi:hypothetical protein